MATILLLCEYPTLCGGERSMLSTLDAVRAAGFRLIVAAPPEGPLANALVAMDVPQVPFATVAPGGERLSRDALREGLEQLLRRHRPAVLHANSLSMGRLAGPVAAEAGVPSLAHLRDIVRLSRQAVADLNRHRRLLAVSHAVRDYHVAAGLKADRTCVVYNGVDLACFCPRPATGYLQRELGLLPETRVVGTIGQICLRKGHDVLVDAAVALSDRFPDVHYVVVGQRNSKKPESIEFEARLRRASQAGPLAGRLHLLGERDDIARLLCELTLLAHPARQEPLGRVLLEAAASGVAIVATAVGGTREIFPPRSHAARLVEPDRPTALSEAIDEMLTDTPQRIALGQNARARAQSAFGIDRAAAALVEQYRQTMA